MNGLLTKIGMVVTKNVKIYLEVTRYFTMFVFQFRFDNLKLTN